MPVCKKFWSVEVNPDNKVNVKVPQYCLLHISQVALGLVPEDTAVNKFPVWVHIDDTKRPIGYLSSDASQFPCDLAIPHDFQVSHGWNNGVVYLSGYVCELSNKDIESSSSVDGQNVTYPLRGIPMVNDFRDDTPEDSYDQMIADYLADPPSDDEEEEEEEIPDDGEIPYDEEESDDEDWDWGIP